jgi:hypothetical protein
MTWFARHPDDDTLAALTLGDDASMAVAAHVHDCPRCQARQAAVAASLAQAHDRLVMAADQAFTAEDLDRQRRTILQRVARLAGPARVLVFPDRPVVRLSQRRSARWIAVAAAAGLAIGAISGQQLSLRSMRPNRQAVAVQQTVQVAAPAAAPDDPLLREVEDALAGTHRPELAALDALMPITYEVR